MPQTYLLPRLRLIFFELNRLSRSFNAAFSSSSSLIFSHYYIFLKSYYEKKKLKRLFRISQNISHISNMNFFFRKFAAIVAMRDEEEKHSKVCSIFAWFGWSVYVARNLRRLVQPLFQNRKKCRSLRLAHKIFDMYRRQSKCVKSFSP